MSQAATEGAAPERQPTFGASHAFHLLGSLVVKFQGQSVALPPHRSQSLLAALLLWPYPHRRERLAGLLFPETSDRNARQRLSHHLWLLRRALPGLPLEADSQEVVLPSEARWLDVEAFRRAADREHLQDWQSALALYRGDLLEGIYDDWLLQEREALYLHYIRLSHRACSELLQRGRFQEGLPLAERLVRREPYDEGALRMLMRAYRARGRRGAALAAYEHFVALAAEELGIEPEPATQALAQSIYAPGAYERSVPPSPSLAGDGPEGRLRRARAALIQGDRTTVQAYIEQIRAHPTCCPEGLALMEIDLALLFEEYDRAEQLLPVIGSHRAPERVRFARLALGRQDAALARDAASEALVLAHDVGDAATELEALLILSEAQQRLGESALALRTSEQALTLARKSESPHGLAQALLVKGFSQFYQGHYERARASFQEGRSVALEHCLRVQQAMALRGIRLMQTYTNALGDARNTIQEELSFWRDLGLSRWEAQALEGLALIQDLQGHSAAALRALEQAQEISRQLGEPVRLAINQYNLACSLLYHDDALAPRARREAEEALARFRAHNQPGWEGAVLTILGYAQWVEGRYAEALAHLSLAYEASERCGELARLPELLAYQGLVQLSLGQPSEALELTRRAVLSLAQGQVSDEVIPEIYYARAMALGASDSRPQAEGYLRRAYNCLLAGAAQFEDAEARQAYFHHNPTLRRLMEELVLRRIAPPPGEGVVSRLLPAARGGSPVQVEWTVDAGPPDAALKQTQGAIALRRARLSRLLKESESQGATPTASHLAEALGVSKRTIQRDLVALRCGA
jgi:DNA-binding SARP family transcriptional activator